MLAALQPTCHSLVSVLYL